MSERSDLLESIADTIKDYRASEIPEPTPDHVDRWIMQFDTGVQVPMLREMDHVLKKSYFPLQRVTSFLRGLLKTENLVGTDPCIFWRSVRFLDIQSGGNSQREMLALFDRLLKEECGFTIEECGKSPDFYVYLDDAIFTGNRVWRDLEAWIQAEAPAKAKLHVITIAQHSGGQYYAEGRINKVIAAAGKNIDIIWWREIELEDRLRYTYTSDVLRPASIPDVHEVMQYIEAMTHKPRLRTPGNVGSNSLFSSEEGRNLLEQEFLKAGVKIRQKCPNLGDTQRPLEEIRADILALEKETEGLLGEIVGGGGN